MQTYLGKLQRSDAAEEMRMSVDEAKEADAAHTAIVNQVLEQKAVC